MPTIVHELRGSMSNLERDTELIFPNIQTCVAVIGVTAGGVLGGAHMTIGDRNRVAAIAVRLRAICGSNPSEVFILGPGLDGWDLTPFKNGGASTVKALDASALGFLDVHAAANGGSVTIGIQPRTGNSPDPQGNNYQAISLSSFERL